MTTYDVNCLCPYLDSHAYPCPYPYPYLNGPNANRRRKRAEAFCDATLLYPHNVRFPIRQNLDLSQHADHVTLWADLNNHMFAMIEPYGPLAEHAPTLNATGTPWIFIPKKFSPYGGGTSTYLLTFPQHVGLLRAIGQNLDSK